MKILQAFCLTLLLAGGSGAKPIDLMLGARPHGMGGAFTGIADDVNAPYWNPAGMTQLKGMAFGASNQINQDVTGVNVNLVNGVIPVKGVGAFGCSWQMINAGLEQGNPDVAADYLEDFWREHTFSLAFARKLWDQLAWFGSTSIGINLNRYMYNSEESHGAGVGFDAGLLTMLPYDIRLGISARSLAADMAGEAFPPEYRLGLGYIRTFAGKHTLTVASDVMLKRDIEYADAAEFDPVSYNVKLFEGVEYAVKTADVTTMVRTGCNLTVLQDRPDSGLNLTAGLGLAYRQYRIDYAFKYNTVPDMSLGIAHHVAFAFVQ